MTTRLILNSGSLEFYGRTFSISQKIEFGTGDVVYVDAPSSEWPSLFLEILSGAAVLRHATSPAAGSAVIRPQAPLAGGELIEVHNGQDSPLTLSARVRANKKDHEAFARRRAKLIGHVFGEPKQFSIGMTVREEYGFSFAAISDPKSFHFPDLAQLRKYGLFDKVDNSTENLSGGESHRLNIACAIDIGVPILICDLGASNLDRPFIGWLEERLGTLRQDRIIVLYNCRRPDFVSVANRFLSLADGNVAEITKQEVEQRQKLLNNRYWLERVGQGDPFLKVENVSVPGRSLPVSFEIASGDVKIVVGENGTGKTTLGRLLTGQIGRRLHQGTVYWSRSDIQRLMTFQYPSSFPSQFRTNQLLDRDDSKKYGLDAYSESYFHDLPFGLQKLLYLIKMMSAQVDLFILDEPFAAVDSEYVPALIDKIRANTSAAFLICNHDPMIESDAPIRLGV